MQKIQGAKHKDGDYRCSRRLHSMHFALFRQPFTAAYVACFSLDYPPRAAMIDCRASAIIGVGIKPNSITPTADTPIPMDNPR